MDTFDTQQTNGPRGRQERDEMKRRKLTAAEVASIEVAKNALRMVPDDVIDEDVVKVISLLREVERHRTTDGKPYIEPQPEIGDGYRPATLSDAHRRDRQVWCDGFWLNAQIGHTETNRVYSVAKDRIPTDEDAVGRPIVMAKDFDDDGWKPGKLIEVEREADQKFYVRLNADDVSLWWDHARFPYPGELD
jgi:hypothetical protein